ncbi:hypothetical protein INF37_01965 [Pseudoflavonifractor sp. DSM 107456]|uniref:Conjugal transfer protein n=1 Tax=Pseudoflavonifractor gallinarum TaxID=2779352 RepID=A0ABR9R7W4_9FIRM|nr:cysteine-rich KTR domain-containing protein [Pseudoflavonifractor gallinarum]MBE5054771.1 hypothetical protein [Pseudoflavonifractor gallinarum]
METLKHSPKCGKLIIKDGYVICPVCKRRTSQMIRPDTQARRLQLWCRHCKATTIVNIESGQCFLSQCPTN